MQMVHGRFRGTISFLNIDVENYCYLPIIVSGIRDKDIKIHSNAFGDGVENSSK